MMGIIERLEALEAPSRGVDLEIMRYVENIGGPAANALHYTASLDAAMTLVPDNCGYAVRRAVGLPHIAAIQAGHKPLRVATSQDGWTDWRRGPSPAIALCIAALRARAL